MDLDLGATSLGGPLIQKGHIGSLPSGAYIGEMVIAYRFSLFPKGNIGGPPSGAYFGSAEGYVILCGK